MSNILKGVKRFTPEPEHELAKAADDLRYLSEWIHTYINTAPPRKIHKEFDKGRLRKLKQRIGLIRWCLGVDVHL